MYQPQLESWEGHTDLEALVAVAITARSFSLGESGDPNSNIARVAVVYAVRQLTGIGTIK